MVSVVVPTRDEIGNIEPLLERLAQVAPDISMEIIFVDDSSDGTDDEIRRLAPEQGRRVTVLHRDRSERWGGLGGAIVDGLRHARGTWICVIDADLQHPPEVIEQMLECADAGSVDLVVASRFCRGGVHNLGRLRGLLSNGSSTLARACFPRVLRKVSDPMSGFFLFRRDAVDAERLKPHGFKILLEILVREPSLRRTEVPFTFAERNAGTSKASMAEARRYLVHLGKLRITAAARLTAFAAVGLTGLAVNTLLLAFFTRTFGLYYILSAILATQGSTLWNFVLSERWVFRGGVHRHSRTRRVVLFYAVNNAALALRGPMLFVLTSVVGIHYLLSNVISLGALTIARFLIADTWIWAKRQLRGGRRIHRYDIHGLITVDSTVALPELERFRVESLSELPSISVRIGKVQPSASSANRLVYDEGLGRAGFAVQITRGHRLEIVASELLRRSPHVLYTNIVEPVLRWTFAEQGFALVHGACLAVGEQAFLITARTDTGKTTTVLKTLDANPLCSFLSDDLSLVSPDGSVLTYPKPMTISRHTVSAVKSPLLSRRERLGLYFQSRIHSRSGRRFAFILTKTGLPVATINALVQVIVPPPKYHVERLIPDVTLGSSARLDRLVVIARGADGSRVLDSDEALELLLEHCEDAYGFPPYEHVASFLHSGNGTDLRAKERETIRQALDGVEATVLTSSSREWWLELRPLIMGDGETAGAHSEVTPEIGLPAESFGLT